MNLKSPQKFAERNSKWPTSAEGTHQRKNALEGAIAAASLIITILSIHFIPPSPRTTLRSADRDKGRDLSRARSNIHDLAAFLDISKTADNADSAPACAEKQSRSSPSLARPWNFINIREVRKRCVVVRGVAGVLSKGGELGKHLVIAPDWDQMPLPQSIPFPRRSLFNPLFCPSSWATGLCEDLIKQNKGESRYSTRSMRIRTRTISNSDSKSNILDRSAIGTPEIPHNTIWKKYNRLRRLSRDIRFKQRRTWLLLGWATAERSCPCKQTLCPAISGGSEDDEAVFHTNRWYRVPNHCVRSFEANSRQEWQRGDCVNVGYRPGPHRGLVRRGAAAKTIITANRIGATPHNLIGNANIGARRVRQENRGGGVQKRVQTQSDVSGEIKARSGTRLDTCPRGVSLIPSTAPPTVHTPLFPFLCSQCHTEFSDPTFGTACDHLHLFG
ncbi:hypothetical protein J6590_044216 [Homalodisca vitripennis]|nr:hypothetical protein J6590_044216 [Homalodisca vitripennis]